MERTIGGKFKQGTCILAGKICPRHQQKSAGAGEIGMQIADCEPQGIDGEVVQIQDVCSAHEIVFCHELRIARENVIFNKFDIGPSGVD
jgi:hypothetical protein